MRSLLISAPLSLAFSLCSFVSVFVCIDFLFHRYWSVQIQKRFDNITLSLRLIISWFLLLGLQIKFGGFLLFYGNGGWIWETDQKVISTKVLIINYWYIFLLFICGSSTFHQNLSFLVLLRQVFLVFLTWMEVGNLRYYSCWTCSCSSCGYNYDYSSEFLVWTSMKELSQSKV